MLNKINRYTIVKLGIAIAVIGYLYRKTTQLRDQKNTDFTLEDEDLEQWPTLTYGESSEEAIANTLGFRFDDNGVLLDKSGDKAESIHGYEVTKENLGGFVNDDDETIPVRDNFPEIVEATKISTDCDDPLAED